MSNNDIDRVFIELNALSQKKGVLSEDGIYNILERNKEIMKILDGFDS